MTNDELDKLLAGDPNNLRIHLKYLLFDLEATRRENMRWRQLVYDLENSQDYPDMDV
ncbi:hypothetical protein LCGC14_1946370 [marine sediment metagenome]|uniref:Uncharacterized protein n=1 Tax=marine sediment metagenome TaxID=412755 RepID=A0A0F9FJ54_9ZZZZ